MQSALTVSSGQLHRCAPPSQRRGRQGRAPAPTHPHPTSPPHPTPPHPPLFPPAATWWKPSGRTCPRCEARRTASASSPRCRSSSEGWPRGLARGLPVGPSPRPRRGCTPCPASCAPRATWWGDPLLYASLEATPPPPPRIGIPSARPIERTAAGCPVCPRAAVTVPARVCAPPRRRRLTLSVAAGQRAILFLTHLPPSVAPPRRVALSPTPPFCPLQHRRSSLMPVQLPPPCTPSFSPALPSQSCLAPHSRHCVNPPPRRHTLLLRPGGARSHARQAVPSPQGAQPPTCLPTQRPTALFYFSRGGGGRACPPAAPRPCVLPPPLYHPTLLQ